jgi:hypothetical protein
VAVGVTTLRDGVTAGRPSMALWRSSGDAGGLQVAPTLSTPAGLGLVVPDDGAFVAVVTGGVARGPDRRVVRCGHYRAKVHFSTHKCSFYRSIRLRAPILHKLSPFPPVRTSDHRRSAGRTRVRERGRRQLEPKRRARARWDSHPRRDSLRSSRAVRIPLASLLLASLAALTSTVGFSPRSEQAPP